MRSIKTLLLLTLCAGMLGRVWLAPDVARLGLNRVRRGTNS